MPERIDLDEAINTGRRSIDASWSKKQKTLVGVVASLVALFAVVGGWNVMQSSKPPRAPHSAAEAVSFMETGRYQHLDSNRRLAYAREASRLFFELSEEERRALLEDEAKRDALRAARRSLMEDTIKKWARGENTDMPAFRPMGGHRPGGGEGDKDGDSDGQQSRRDRMQERVRSMIAQQVASGDAQMGALRTEFFRTMMQQRRQ